MTGVIRDYIDDKYLPASIPNNFKLIKLGGSAFPKKFLIDIAEHIVSRQRLKLIGQVERVFGWKRYWCNVREEWVEVGKEEDDEEVQGTRKRRNRKTKRRITPVPKRPRPSDVSEDEIRVGLDALSGTSDAPEDPSDDEDLPNVEDVFSSKGKDRIHPDSPASVDDSWVEKLTFLRGLSSEGSYQRLVEWLELSQVRCLIQAHKYTVISHRNHRINPS